VELRKVVGSSPVWCTNGKPTSQSELDEMFGNEVGGLAHYFKNMVIDQNGQVSYSYTDMHDRVIATCISGVTPPNLLVTDGQPQPRTTSDNLLDNNNLLTQDNELLSSTTLMVDAAQTYSFNYVLGASNKCVECLPPNPPIEEDPPGGESTERLMPLSFCEDCKYNLTLEISDENGVLVPGIIITSGADTYSNPLNLQAISSGTVAFSVLLQPGIYSITKTLEPVQLPTATLDNAVSALRGCYENPIVSIDGCAIDCPTACNNIYINYDNNGNITSYVNENNEVINQTQAQALIATCIAACDNNLNTLDITQGGTTEYGSCERKLLMLKEDMSPGGQYFENMINPTDRNEWLETKFGVINPAFFALAQTDLLSLGISATITSWDDVRNNWNPILLETNITAVGGTTTLKFYQWHPEFLAYYFFCEGIICNREPNLANNINSFPNLMMAETASTLTTDDFNPLAGPLNVSTLLPSEYNPYTYGSNSLDPLATTSSYTIGGIPEKCELKLCPDNTSNKISIIDYPDPLVDFEGYDNNIADILLYNMYNFYEYNDQLSTPVNYKYTIWYVMDDPDNIAHATAAPIGTPASPPTTYPEAIVAYFQSIHGTGATSLLNTPIAKYSWFRDQYRLYRDFLLYTYFKKKYPSYSFCNNNTNGLSVTNPYFACRYPSNDVFENYMSLCSKCFTPTNPNAANCTPGKIIFTPVTYTFSSSGYVPANYTGPNTATTTITTTIATQCTTDCQNSADEWMQKLLDCGITSSHSSYNDIRTNLIAVCAANCGQTASNEVVMGSSGLPAGANAADFPPGTGNTVACVGCTTNVTFSSFTEVINYFLAGSISIPATTCFTSIYTPSISSLNPPVSQDIVDGDCACKNMIYYIKNSMDFDPSLTYPYSFSNFAAIATALNSNTGASYTANDVQVWFTECYKYKPSKAVLTAANFPSSLNCTSPVAYNQASCSASRFKDFLNAIGITWNATYSVAEISNIVSKINLFVAPNPSITIADFNAWMPELNSTSPNIANLLSNHYPAIFVCPAPASTANIDVSHAELLNACQLQSLMASTSYAIDAYTTTNTAISNNFENQYTTGCLNNIIASQNTSTPLETFTVDYYKSTFDYTLYYYDQAGNLIKTIPPDGVRLLNTSQITQSMTYRNASAVGTTTLTPVYPSHRMVTNYKYNFQDKLLSQTTPDAGTTKFYYNKKHELIISQNAKQAPQANYSYTNYDGLGRITEVGEITPGININSDVTLGFDNTLYLALKDALDLPSNKSQITKTFYDEQLASTLSFYVAKNTRNRVVNSTYDENGDQLYESASHYSYDIHGNVNTLFQENKDLQLQLLGHTLKRIDYNYDVISGKVNEFHYQTGFPDQYHYKYAYDADNRITHVFTSKDGNLYFKEAKYFYYPHGPLARVEIGDKQVQGNDYAYTLNGWIKGVNSSTLMLNRDLGKDALSRYAALNLSANTYQNGNLNQNFGGDVFGYALDYYQGDYKAVKNYPSNSSSTETDNYFLTVYDQSGANTMNGVASLHSLYNGNISRMINAMTDQNENQLETMAKMYKYDQLNRLRNVDMYTQSNIQSSNVWSSTAAAIDNYKEEFHYSLNGNIGSVLRYGNTGIMDDMTYRYQATQLVRTNKLLAVSDAVPSTAYNNIDIDDMNYISFDDGSIPNYAYDPIGNLIEDKSEDIDNGNGGAISWNVYNKITEVRRKSGSDKADLVFKYDPAGNRIMKIVKEKHLGLLKNQSDWKQTYYVRDAQGNTLATYELNFEPGANANLLTHKLELIEVPIYGSSRLGTYEHEYKQNSTLNITGYDAQKTIIYGTNSAITLSPVNTTMFDRKLGAKSYELSNHLGNVMSVITDKKIQKNSNVFKGIEEFEFSTKSSTVQHHNGERADELYNTFPPSNPQLYSNSSVFSNGFMKPVEPGDYVKANIYSITNGNAVSSVIVAFVKADGTTEATVNGNNWVGAVLPNSTTWTNTSTPASTICPTCTYTDASGSIYVIAPVDAAFVKCFSWNPAQSHVFVDDLELEIIHNGNLTELDHYTADVISSTDYYSFGSSMPGRKYSASTRYRYGFQNQEEDPELWGGAVSFKYRLEDPRLGRFFSVDPLAASYPWNSPYAFSENRVLDAIELEGLECFFLFETPPIIVRPVAKPALEIISEDAVKIGVEVGTEATQPKVTPRFTPEQIENFKRGMAAEKEQLKKMGQDKNTESVTEEVNGKPSTSVPDYKTSKGGWGEIKNVKKQGWTRQLKTQQKASNKVGQKSELLINKDAKLSNPLKNSGIDIKFYNTTPPAQDNLNVPKVDPLMPLTPVAPAPAPSSSGGILIDPRV